MVVRYFVDPATGQPHIYQNGERSRGCLGRAMEDPPGRDESRIAIGQTAAGRYLRVIYVRDRLIAATALLHDLMIATRNVADFKKTGVRVVSPFDER